MRTGGELTQLHVEVFIIGIVFLRLQVMVSLRASWEVHISVFIAFSDGRLTQVTQADISGGKTEYKETFK